MKRGFTLIEILISIAILSIVVTGIIAVLRIGDMAWHSDMGLVDLQQAARQVMDGMVREIRQSLASTVTIGATGADITFSIPNIPNIKYYLSNAQIIRQQPAGTGTTKVLANAINNLSFCWDHGSTCDTNRNGSYMIKMQLKARKTVMQKTLSFPVLEGEYLTEKVRLRNE